MTADETVRDLLAVSTDVRHVAVRRRRNAPVRGVRPGFAGGAVLRDALGEGG